MSAGASRASALRSGRVYLTFDDGPHPRWTPAVARELSRLRVQATFFVIAEQAAAHPGIVKQLSAAGHEVELHCMHHHDHRDMSRAGIDADVGEALGILAGLGIHPQRWRPPFGNATGSTSRVAADRRLELVGWSCDPCDWRGDPVEHMLARIAQQLESGSVVLLHDGVGPGALRRDCADTVRLLEPLVRLIRAHGCRPAPLAQGPAFWWSREGPKSGRRSARELVRVGRDRLERRIVLARHSTPIDYQVETVDETLLAESDRAHIAALLAEVFANHSEAYETAGWRTIPPTFRTLARSRGDIVGQLSVFEISTDPPLRLFGLGDAGVRPDCRRRGIARSLTEKAVQECWERGAEILLTDTAALRPIYIALGFVPVPRFAFYYERAGQCRWHPLWLSALRTTGPRPRLRLAEGDF